MVPEKWSLGKMVLGKMVPEKNGLREKWSPDKWPPGKMVPGKLIPGKLKTEKSWGKIYEIYENPKFDNKPETRKQTRNTETKNRRVSVEHHGVCVECSDVINL